MFRMKEESSSLSSLKEEFAQRIADAEKKLQLACKERDAAKKVIWLFSEINVYYFTMQLNFLMLIHKN